MHSRLLLIGCPNSMERLQLVCFWVNIICQESKFDAVHEHEKQFKFFFLNSYAMLNFDLNRKCIQKTMKKRCKNVRVGSTLYFLFCI